MHVRLQHLVFCALQVIAVCRVGGASKSFQQDLLNNIIISIVAYSSCINRTTDFMSHATDVHITCYVFVKRHRNDCLTKAEKKTLPW